MVDNYFLVQPLILVTQLNAHAKLPNHFASSVSFARDKFYAENSQEAALIRVTPTEIFIATSILAPLKL